MVIAGNKPLARSGSNRRVAVIRPNSPKSPAASASADGSDEDDATQNGRKLDNGYINTNGNFVSYYHQLAMVLLFSYLLVFYTPSLSYIYFYVKVDLAVNLHAREHRMVHHCFETVEIMPMV